MVYIENPSSSLMWVTDPMQRLSVRLRQRFFGLVFDTCMFGATRLKHTALWTNVVQLRQLARTCDKSRKHDECGNSFATALECAYNKPLADAWAACIKHFALDAGVIFPPQTMSEITHGDMDLSAAFNKAALGQQPRCRKLPPVMTDLLEAP